MARLDRIDRTILDILAGDARISNAELAARVHLSPTPCLRRVKRLEDSGIIKRYVAEYDLTGLGLHITAFVFVQLERNSQANASAFEEAVAELPQVLDCYVLTGAHDYLLRVAVQDLAHYEKFIKKSLAAIDQIVKLDSTIILNQVLSRPVLPLQGHE